MICSQLVTVSSAHFWGNQSEQIPVGSLLLELAYDWQQLCLLFIA